MTETRLTPDIELDGISPEEAFAVLGNEIRLELIRVLWQADATYEYEDVSDTAGTMSFSELRRRVGVDDNGKFNYHLSQLSPHFVRQTEDGYRLSGAGKQIARTVVAVTGTDDLDFTADLDRDCPLCGAAVTATYEDQWLRVRCTECEGLFGDEAPTGALLLSQYPAAGLSGRDAGEALATGLYRCHMDLTYMMRGICRECAGRVSASLDVCEDHESRGGHLCGACGTPFPVWTEQRCETCGFAKRLPIEICVMGLSPVISFLDDQGIDALAPSLDEIVEVFDDGFAVDVKEDPLRVSITIEDDRRALDLTLDDELNVVDLDRRRSD